MLIVHFCIFINGTQVYKTNQQLIFIVTQNHCIIEYAVTRSHNKLNICRLDCFIHYTVYE